MIRTTLCAMAALCIGFFTQVNAENETTTCYRSNVEGKKLTAFYMVSSDDDYIGAGQTIVYFEGQNAHFTLNNSDKHISLRLQSLRDDWDIEFYAPQDQTLQPGIYKNAKRAAFHSYQPGLSFTGCGRACNESIGEFEVLEIQYNDKGKIEAFAANFVQKCEYDGSPLYGCIRYNSSVPIEVSFRGVFEEQAVPMLFLIKYDPITNNFQPLLISSRESTFCFKRLPYGEEGIEVSIDADNLGSWFLDFAVPFGEELKEDTYKSALRYPFHGLDNPGIKVVTPERGFLQSKGEFEVLRLKKTDDGQVEALALDFKVQNPNGEIIAGSIRLNSDLPVDLTQFFDNAMLPKDLKLDLN